MFQVKYTTAVLFDYVLIAEAYKRTLTADVKGNQYDNPKLRTIRQHYLTETRQNFKPLLFGNLFVCRSFGELCFIWKRRTRTQ